tara:strand:- start:55 stop:444 length:390 start_codon:yes stop_codon:yes gene_type:complete
MNVIDFTLSDLLQLGIGASIVFIWVCRTTVASSYRVGNAQTLSEEFTEAGFTEGVYMVMRVLKPIFAFLLVIGIVYEPFFIPCMTFTTLAMIGAVYAHVKVRDNIKKMIPAITLLVFCFVVLTCPSKWV